MLRIINFCFWISILGSRIHDARMGYANYLARFDDSQDWRFKSLYPIQEMLNTIRSQEDELKRLRERVGEMPPEDDTVEDVLGWEMPF